MTSDGSEATDRRARRAVLTAIALMLLAGLMSSFLHLGVRWASPHLPAIEIVFLRSAFTLAVTLPFLLATSRDAWRTNHPTLQIVRGFVGVASMGFWYYALGQMPLADAGVLSFTTGIFITIGAALWFREAVGLRRWSAVAIGLLGAIVVLKPGFETVSFAAVAAIGSSMLWAISLLMAKQLARHDSTLTISFYQPLITAPIAGLLAVPVWVWPSADIWLVLAGMGAVAAIGNYCYVHALRIAEASVTVPADYVRLLWMVMWGWLLFSEIPGWSTWLGAALIVGSTMFIAWRESRLAAARRGS
jgi:drug/metabolite transporter (DMT)-like permease